MKVKQWLENWLPWEFVLIVVSVALIVLILLEVPNRDLTGLEIIVLQVLISACGLVGSFWLGRYSARKAAIDVVTPHARSALRTILTLRNSLVGLSRRIEEYKRASDDHRFDILQAIVHEQIPVGRSAVEDWRDIVPEDVDKVLKRWSKETED